MSATTNEHHALARRIDASGRLSVFEPKPPNAMAVLLASVTEGDQ